MIDVLSQNFTKSQCLAALGDLGQKTRFGKVKQKDYDKVLRLVESIEPLHVETAISLSADQLKEIVEMLRKDYGKNFLIETSVNPDLIGGATLSYKGIFKDYSVRANILTIDGRK